MCMYTYIINKLIWLNSGPFKLEIYLNTYFCAKVFKKENKSPVAVREMKI